MNGHSIQELTEIVGGRLRLGDLPPLGGAWEPTGRLVVDVQTVSDGDVLLVLPQYFATNRCCVDEAFSRGALGVIAAGKPVEPWAGKFSIQVDEAQWALWQLARSARQHFDGRVIAVAGPVGKSTTAAMIDAVLGVDRRGCGVDTDIHSKQGNITTGDLLAAQMLALRDDADYAVLELHARTKGDLDTAAHLACPHIAVATAIESSLLGDDADRELAPPSFLDELFTALPDDGCAIASGDALHVSRERSGHGRWLTYGRSGHCDVQATHVLAGEGSLAFAVGGQLVRISASGRHHLPLALAAWCAGRACGVREADIAARLEKFQPLAHRCRTIVSAGITLIDDAAGRSPVAARAALAVLHRASASGRRIAICGEFDPHWAGVAAYRRLGRDCVTVGGADLVAAIGSGASAIAAGAYEQGMPSSSCIVLDSPVNALCELRRLIAAGDVAVATAVEPSLADALVASFPDNSQRAAA